jgi:hypothetical protein
VATQGTGDIVAWQVNARVPSDSDVIIVDQNLHVEVVGDGDSSRFSIVTFLLGTVRTETKDSFAPLADSDAVDKGPLLIDRFDQPALPDGGSRGKTKNTIWPSLPLLNFTPGVRPWYTMQNQFNRSDVLHKIGLPNQLRMARELRICLSIVH